MRSRKCINELTYCDSRDLNEIQNCSILTCSNGYNDFFGWSEWSTCSETCGYGKQYKTKRCSFMEIKSGLCKDKENFQNIMTRSCILKTCKYNRHEWFDNRTISCLVIMMFVLGLISILVKYKHKFFFVKK